MTWKAGEDRFVLVAASCTTGWFDWAHGRLWLCPTGLLRETTGLAATIERRGRPEPFDPANRPTWTLTAAERDAVVRAGPRNVWVAWPDIARATLKRGIVDHSLHIDRADGTRVKFLWLMGEGGFDVLAAALSEALRDRFRIQNRPVG